MPRNSPADPPAWFVERKTARSDGCRCFTRRRSSLATRSRCVADSEFRMGRAGQTTDAGWNKSYSEQTSVRRTEYRERPLHGPTRDPCPTTSDGSWQQLDATTSPYKYLEPLATAAVRRPTSKFRGRGVELEERSEGMEATAVFSPPTRLCFMPTRRIGDWLGIPSPVSTTTSRGL